jgi:hypothetical protein
MSKLNRSVIVSLAASLVLTALSTSPAQARRVAIDSDVPEKVDACSLGAAVCAAIDLPFPIINADGTFDKIYVYDFGVASLGAPLPVTASVAGGAASLGSSFIASGFADYSGDLPDVYLTFADDNFIDSNGNNFVGQFRVTWAYPDPNRPIWDLSLTDLSVDPSGDKDPAKFGDVGLSLAHGSDLDTWAGFLPVQQEPFLPPGALVGWKIGSREFTQVIPAGFDLDNADFSVNLSVVPEPQTWAMMIVGFGLAGTALRRRQGFARAL